MNETLTTIPESLGRLARNINDASDGFGDLATTVGMSLGLGAPALPATTSNDVPGAMAAFVETVLATADVFARAAEVARSLVCRPVTTPVQIPSTPARDLDEERADARLPGEIPAEAPPDLDSIPWPIRSRMGTDEASLGSTADHEAEGDQIVLAATPTPEPAPVEDAETPAVIPSEPGSNGRHRPAKKGGNRRGG